MQGAFNTKTKRQLEICKQLPLKLDFEVKFKEAHVAFPNPSIHAVLLAGGDKSSCLLLGSELTLSPDRALAQLTMCVGPAAASARGAKTALQTHSRDTKATLRGRCSSAHVGSMCKQNSTFLPSQLSSKGRRVRAQLPHLHPTWITRDNLQPPNAGASLVMLFSMSFESSKGSQDCLCCTLLMTNPFTKNCH